MDGNTSEILEYGPVLLLLLVAVAFAVGASVVSVLAGKFANRHRLTPNRTKDTPYECGMIAQGEGSPRLSVKFYLVAMLFILFDIELVFMYPWAVTYKELLGEPGLGGIALGSMLSFVGVLFVGYLYALKKKAFEWKT